MATGDGLVTVTPTSVQFTGTSAVINADGGVDFNAVTTLSLNGIFSSAQENYLVAITVRTASGLNNLYSRLRASGSDASGANYNNQLLSANNTTIAASRITGATQIQAGAPTTSVDSGFVFHIYAPFLAQATSIRSTVANSENLPRFDDYASTHTLSSSYDGLTFDNGLSLSGVVHVFGYEE